MLKVTGHEYIPGLFVVAPPFVWAWPVWSTVGSYYLAAASGSFATVAVTVVSEITRHRSYRLSVTMLWKELVERQLRWEPYHWQFECQLHKRIRSRVHVNKYTSNIKTLCSWITFCCHITLFSCYSAVSTWNSDLAQYNADHQYVK